MALGVGTYSDGFGVAFTLLDQFSAVAKRIQSSMDRLQAHTASFAAKTSGVLDAAFGGNMGISKSGHLANLPGIAPGGSIMGAEAAKKEAARIALATGTAQIAMMGELEAAELAEATLAATLMEGKMRQNRLYNSIQREQLILNRQAETQAIATASAEAALNAERAMGLTLLGASLVGLSLIVKGAVVESRFQKAELTIEGFVGSAQKAHEAFLQIQADASANPMMGFENMLKTNSLLLSQGIGSDQSERITKNLSALLTSVGRGAPELNRVGRELEKIAANGKITGRELYQAAAAGIPLRNILEDYFGHKLPDTLKELPITIDDLDKAFAKAMMNGGRYGKAFAKIAESTAFMWSDLTHNQIPQFFAAVGAAVEPVTNMVVTGLGFLFNVLKLFSQSWVGQAFWVISASLLVLAGTIGLNIVGGKAWTWVLARLTHGLGHATIASLKASMANEGLAASFALLGETVMANPAFVWFTTIAGIVLVASNAIRHFKRVLSGQEDAALGGWVSTLQKLGGVLMFVAEAFSTYDSATHQSKFSQEFVTAIDKLGLHDITSKLETWIGSIMSFMDGFTDGLYTFFHTLYTIFEFITAPIRWVLKLLGLLTPDLDTANGAMQGWAVTGKMLAWVLGTLLVGQLWKMGVAFVLAIQRIVAAEAELYAFSAPLLATLWPAMILIAGSAALIASNIDVMGNSFDKNRKPITEATIALEEYNAALQKSMDKQDLITRAHYAAKQGAMAQFEYFFKYGLPPDPNEAKPPTAISNPDQMNLPDKQQQQATIDTARGTTTYPGLSSSGPSTDKRDINVTLNLDGKTLATILAPYNDEITRRNNMTSNYG